MKQKIDTFTQEIKNIRVQLNKDTKGSFQKSIQQRI